MRRRLHRVGMAVLLISVPMLGRATERVPQAAHPQEVSKKPEKADPSTPLAVLGGTVITVGDLENRINQALPQFRARFSSVEGKRALLNSMIDSRLLYQEALRRGLDQESLIKDRLQSFAEQLYSGELTRRILQDVSINEDTARAYYEQHPQEFSPPDQIRVRLILLKNEEEARAVLKQIRNGGVFAELAKIKSVDSRTAAIGGELGWIQRGVLPQELEKAVFALSVGGVSEVVATRDGFHILQVEEKRPGQLNPFESEKLRILTQLKGQKQRETVENFKKELRERANVVIREDLLQPQPVSDPETTSRMPQPGAVPAPPPLR